MACICGLHISDSGCGLEAGFCEHGNERLDLYKVGNFLTSSVTE
jgi:hypothetical protein